MTSENSRSVTSSQESEDGVLLSDSQDGLMIEESGQEVVHVSRFRARDKEKALPMNVTCGPLFSNSSPSANLQSALVNKLVANLESSGSPLFDLTWKAWDMFVEPPICLLRASGRRISVSAFTGWPTVCASLTNDHQSPKTYFGRKYNEKKSFPSDLTIAVEDVGGEVGGSRTEGKGTGDHGLANGALDDAQENSRTGRRKTELSGRRGDSSRCSHGERRRREITKTDRQN